MFTCAACRCSPGQQLGKIMNVKSAAQWPWLCVKSQRKFLWVRRGCQASERKGLTSGELRGTSGEVRELLGNLWIAVKFHSERSSGEVAGELPGKSRDFSEARGSLNPSQRLANFVSRNLQHSDCGFGSLDAVCASNVWQWQTAAANSCLRCRGYVPSCLPWMTLESGTDSKFTFEEALRGGLMSQMKLENSGIQSGSFFPHPTPKSVDFPS